MAAGYVLTIKVLSLLTPCRDVDGDMIIASRVTINLNSVDQAGCDEWPAVCRQLVAFPPVGWLMPQFARSPGSSQLRSQQLAER
jgi:hypothetical protein